MSKRFFQAILIVVGLILAVTSLWGLIAGAGDELYELNISHTNPGHVIMDSNLRFYYGLTLGLGLIILWITPGIERHRTLLGLISLMIFLGAVGRFVSMAEMGTPSFFFVFFTSLELFFPLLLLWHRRLV
jgi:hypothetical protein